MTQRDDLEPIGGLGTAATNGGSVKSWRLGQICVGANMEPQDVISVHPDGVQTCAKSSDASWLDGPPYALVGHVFDECSFGALYASAADVPS